MARFKVGTAAWTLPKDFKSLFPESGSHLERYAKVLTAVEINTSFYKPHKRVTYERWAASVPGDFKFSVKLEKLFTHERKLVEPGAELEDRINGILGLGDKLGCLLIQLPPKLEFEEETASIFFESLKSIYSGPIALEPRHKSWSSSLANRLRREMQISQVYADPEPYSNANDSLSDDPSFLHYYRLHGSPETYRSDYERERLEAYADLVRASKQNGHETWCIFDNTTFGFATRNAVDLLQML